MHWLDSWEAFIRVAEHGTMAAAARALGCSRAQISKQIGELERSLGAQLFERSTRALRLTAAGAAFMPHARAALQAVSGAEMAVRNLDDAPRGVLRISATVVFGRRFVAPLLPALLARHPELSCELILSDDLVDLIDDDIDVALRMTRLPPQDAIARELTPLRRVICASPAFLATHGVPDAPHALAGMPCFGYLGRDGGVWRLRGPDGAELAVPIHGRLQFNNPECMLEAVLAGHGIAILPTYLCSEALASGKLQAVLQDYEPATVFGQHLYACYTRNRARLPKVRVFIEALERSLQPIPPWERA